MKRWYNFTFTDGYSIMCADMSATELKTQEKKHGKLLTKRPC